MNTNKHVVVFSGAGISVESGIQAFRGKGGLWEKMNPEELASPQAWNKDPGRVLDFYNQRRRQLNKVKPNQGHIAIAELEKDCKLTVITQNVDDLHERAGNRNILHLHGELKKARSTADPSLIYDIGGKDIQLGDTCEKGSQLRPHIVWFGEPVMDMEKALDIIKTADHLIIAGTSLSVYPAAGLVYEVPETTKVYVVNPEEPEITINKDVVVIKENASKGLPKVIEMIRKD